MRRKNFAFPVVAMLAVLLGACDTVTDLSEVNVDGVWDGVGALQQEIGQVTLSLGPEAADGTFSGTWRLQGEAYPITNGTNQDGVVQFTLQGFQGGAPALFSGELTNRFRLEGDLSAGLSQGERAVFRLYRPDPDA
ncbi:MAG: hypothetical protein WD960_15805 [Gemmatimonadota bacterium]